MLLSCHVCGSTNVRELAGATTIVGVSSDCVPLGHGQRLAACLNCRTIVTILSEAWRELCRDIYVGYEAYRQAAGSEDLVFTGQGAASGRSGRILDLCASDVSGTARPWLDFGCGNGAFLRSVSERFPGQKLVGMEFDDHVRDEIIGIPGVLDLVTSWDSDLASGLGVVSMIHVLEHIEDPRALLKTVREQLMPGGTLVVEVPHVWTNPYALTVSDHATHFGPASLLRLVVSAGFDVSWVAADRVPGEITLVARRPVGREHAHGPGEEERLGESTSAIGILDAGMPQQLLDGLVATAGWLADQREAYETLGILGTSVAGTWAAASLGLSHDLWVDEDPTRAGLAWLGKRIYTPREVPPGTQVLAVLAPSKARLASGRLTAAFQQFTVATPPDFGAALEGADSLDW